MVTLTIYNGDLSINDNWGIADLCILPWKPAYQVFFSITLQDGLSGVIGVVELDGQLKIQGKGTQWRRGWLFGAASYVCA